MPTTFTTGHVGLNVTDLERSSAFYQSIFGFQTIGQNTNPEHAYAFLGDGEKLILTLWQQSEGKFNSHQPGLHHLSFQVGTIEEVQEAEQRVRALGAKLYHDGIVPHSEGGQSGGIFFEDPDGTRLEIFAPSGANENEAPTPGAPTCGFF